jgi:hypothetical protein
MCSFSETQKTAENRELTLWHLVSMLVLEYINKHGASKIIDTFETYQIDLPEFCVYCLKY